MSSVSEAFSQISNLINDWDNLSRVVFSGRRRNFQPNFERIEIRPVEIKGEAKYQIGRAHV